MTSQTAFQGLDGPPGPEPRPSPKSQRRTNGTRTASANPNVKPSSDPITQTVEALPFAAAVLDQDGVIRAVNRAWRKNATVGGYRGDDFFVGWNYLDIFPKPTGKGAESPGARGEHPARAGLNAVLTGKMQHFDYKYPCHAPNQNRWFRLHASPVEVDERPGALIYHINVTKEHEDQDMLTRALDRARAFQSAQKLHVAGINHDLRAPLNAIKGYLEMVESIPDLSDEKKADYLRNARRASDHMLDLVTDLLVRTRDEEQRLRIQAVPIDLGALILDLTDDLKVSTPTVEVVLDIVPSLPGLLGDPTMMRRIFENLLSNCVKHAGPRCTVAIAAACDTDGLRISVTDDGPGIPKHAMDAALTPFLPSPAKAADSVGLGVFLVRAMVKAHDGVFDIQRLAGKGTRTTIRFPVKRLLKATLAAAGDWQPNAAPAGLQ